MKLLLELSASELVSAQLRGELSAVQILAAYKRRAAEVHAAANCLTCWVPDAELAAEACDAYLALHGAPIGNLHGVPCTVKDHYAVKGLPVTMGMSSLKARSERSGGARHDAVAVVALRAAGAVLFAKTNMTQLGSTWGGGNPAFGDTLNSHDTLRTSGGSSSGEGTVVGAGGSVFGIGSDVGGLPVGSHFVAKHATAMSARDFSLKAHSPCLLVARSTSARRAEEVSPLGAAV